MYIWLILDIFSWNSVSNKTWDIQNIISDLSIFFSLWSWGLSKALNTFWKSGIHSFLYLSLLYAGIFSQCLIFALSVSCIGGRIYINTCRIFLLIILMFLDKFRTWQTSVRQEKAEIKNSTLMTISYLMNRYKPNVMSLQT